MRAIGSLACVCAVVVAAIGCGKRHEQSQSQPPEPAPSPEEIAQIRLYELRAELTSLKTNGQDSVVLTRLQSEVTNSVMAPVKGTVFAWLMSEMVSQGQTNEVREAYMGVLGRDDDLARGGFGIVDSLYQQVGDWAGLLAWNRSLLDRKPPADLLPLVWMQIVRAQRAQGSLAAFVDDVPQVVASLPEVQAERVASMALQLALEGKEYALAEQMVEAVSVAGAGSSALARFARLSRLDVLLASGRLDDAATRLWADGGDLTDADAAPRAVRLMAAWRTGGQADAESTFATRALAEWSDKPTSRDSVAAAWVRAALEDKKLDAFMDRMDASVNARAGAVRLLAPFEEGFYAVMSGGTDEQKRRCEQTAANLQALPSAREREVTRLSLMRLDGSFYMNDFRAALDIVRAGIPGHDADWHSVLTNKIAAHMALAENRPEDAIRCFRAHMEKVSAWERPEQNPQNGLLMHKEAVLGFNEKRVGDIYAGMGRADDAAASYARARGYYEEALKAAGKDTEEYAAYVKEMADVPASSPAPVSGAGE